MPNPTPSPIHAPRLPIALLRALLPRAERDELLADVATEYAHLAAERGVGAARRWIWWQTLRSAPGLTLWRGWREWTGFEPRANAFRPGGAMLKTLFADLHYAARRLRTRPTHTLLVVLTLALGIGGTAAVFGIARPVLFKALPYTDAGRLGMFWMPGWWTEQEFTYLRDKFAGFSEVAAYRPSDVTLREGDSPARLVGGISTSWELFDVLGVRPMLGRAFHRGDDVAGAESIAIIDHGLWKQLGGTPAVVGKRVMLDGTPTTIVGVMPAGFWFPDPAVRIWRPQPIDPERQNGSYAFVGRVAPGGDVNHMDAPLRRLTTTIKERFHYAEGADKTLAPAITPLRQALLGSMRPAALSTLAVMAMILLIACANVAALMLGQVEGRSTELAVRSALGATRERIIQQLFVEVLLVGLVAAAAGAALAVAGLGTLARALPLGAWSEGARFDWSLFSAALLLALAAVSLVALVPAWALRRGDLRGTLVGGRTGGIQGRGGRLERGLVVAEVALAMLVATGAALLVHSVRNLYAIETGLRPHGLAVIDVVGSAEERSADRGRTVKAIAEELAALPGVERSAVTMKLPLRGGGDSFDIDIPGNPAAANTFTNFRTVTRDYFATMGITVHEGRTFDASDQPIRGNDTSHVMSIVVNDAFVKEYFPGQSALGREVRGGFNVPQRIVGVVANVAETALTDSAAPTRYYLGDQTSWFENRATFVLRARRERDIPALLDQARRIVQRVAPEMAVQETTTMDRVLDEAVGPARQVMSLLAVLSALALALGAIGIYGVISHFASRRKRDWAIRCALGLTAERVMAHIVGQGVMLVAMGVAAGLVGALALRHLLASLLYGVGTVDLVAFAGAALALFAIGAVAAFIPARRAGTVDPARVLREQ